MEQLDKILADKVENLMELTAQNGAIKAQRVYKCSKCKDIEWLINSATNTASECSCRASNRYRLILEKSGISNSFLSKTFENYLPKNAMQEKVLSCAKNYVENYGEVTQVKNNSIAFLGQVGSGKTHLAIAIANALMAKNIGVLYLQYREVLTLLKQKMIDSDFYQGNIDKYKNAPVLLVDDLFKGKITESDINIIYEIINFRYLKGLPIITTSEYKAKKLLEIDEAITSRVIEMSNGRLYQFDGIGLNNRLI